MGASSVVPPVLLSEIATAETRGTITTLHQAVLTLAIFVASVLGYGMVTYVEHGWQYIQAFGAVPGVLMLLLHSFVPESPKWLLGRSMARRRAPTSSGLDVEARNSLAGAAGSTGDADGSDRDSKPASSSDFSMSRPSLSALGTTLLSLLMLIIGVRLSSQQRPRGGGGRAADAAAGGELPLQRGQGDPGYPGGRQEGRRHQ